MTPLKKPIWAFFGEGGNLPKLSTLMFFPSRRQQMLGKKQIHSTQLPQPDVAIQDKCFTAFKFLQKITFIKKKEKKS